MAFSGRAASPSRGVGRRPFGPGRGAATARNGRRGVGGGRNPSGEYHLVLPQFTGCRLSWRSQVRGVRPGRAPRGRASDRAPRALAPTPNELGRGEHPEQRHPPDRPRWRKARAPSPISGSRATHTGQSASCLEPVSHAMAASASRGVLASARPPWLTCAGRQLAVPACRASGTGLGLISESAASRRTR